MSNKYPQYISFERDKAASVLRFRDEVDGIAVYERPLDTGAWSVSVHFEGDKLMTSDYEVGNLKNREVFPVSEDKFLLDNYPWILVNKNNESTIK